LIFFRFGIASFLFVLLCQPKEVHTNIAQPFLKFKSQHLCNKDSRN